MPISQFLARRSFSILKVHICYLTPFHSLDFCHFNSKTPFWTLDLNTVHWFIGFIIHWYSQYIKLVKASSRLGARVWWVAFSSRWRCQQKSGPGPTPAEQWAGGCFSTGQGADVTWVGRSRMVDVSRRSSWALSCYCWAVGWCDNVQPGRIKRGTSALPPDTPAAPVNVKKRG